MLMDGRPLYSGDLADLDLGELFAMADLLAEALAPFHFEGDHLFSLHITDDLGIDFHLHVGTDGQLAVRVHQKDVRELDLIAILSFEMGNIEFLAFLDPELLTGYFNNCKHDPTKFRSAKVGGKTYSSKNCGGNLAGAPRVSWKSRFIFVPQHIAIVP